MYSFKPSPHPHRGFTLIEVLLAVAILSIVALVVTATFASTIRVLEAGEEEGGFDRTARVSLSRLAHELSMGGAYPSFPWLGKNGVMNNAPSDLVAFVTTDPTLSGALGADGVPVRLVYARQDDRLVRFSTHHLYGVSAASFYQDEVAEGVRGFNVRYYDGKSRQWVDEWDSQVTKSPPQAVMVEVSLGNSGQEARNFTEWVLIPSSTP